MTLFLTIVVLIVVIIALCSFLNWIGRTAGRAAEEACCMGVFLTACWATTSVLWFFIYLFFFFLALNSFLRATQ